MKCNTLSLNLKIDISKFYEENKAGTKQLVQKFKQLMHTEFQWVYGQNKT